MSISRTNTSTGNGNPTRNCVADIIALALDDLLPRDEYDTASGTLRHNHNTAWHYFKSGAYITHTDMLDQPPEPFFRAAQARMQPNP